MTTKLYLLALAAATTAAMSSCSQDEPISVATGENAISFRPAMGASRAVETTNDNLSQITVSSFIGDQLYIDQVAYNKDSDGFFKSSPEYNWPGDDSQLTFYAYAPANPGDVTITKDAKTLTDFSPATSPADQIDFITATATGTRTANEASGVELTFNHQLSQIEVLAKTDNTLYDYEISGVRIGQPVSIGSFDFDSAAWTLGTDKAIYEETYTTPVKLTSTAASVMGTEGNAMLLPQQLTAWTPDTDGSNTAKGAYLSVKLRITTAETGAQLYPFPSNGDCQWAAIPIDTNWEPGKKYIYTLDLTNGAGYVDPNDPIPGDPVLGGPIRFTVNVVDWTDAPVALPMTTDK